MFKSLRQAHAARRNWIIFCVSGMVASLKALKWPEDLRPGALYAIRVLERLLAQARNPSIK